MAKTITLLKATEDKSPCLYVLNTSDINGQYMKGDVNISVVTSRGQTLNIVVPSTWIPIDMSEYLPKDELLKDPMFLRMIRSKRITLISENDAIEILNQPDAVIEKNRITMQTNGITRNPEIEDDEDDEKQKSTNKTEEDGVQIVTVEVVQRLKEYDIDESTAYSTLKNSESRLLEKDLEYIINHTESEKLKNFASDRLVKTRSQRRASA